MHTPVIEYHIYAIKMKKVIAKKNKMNKGILSDREQEIAGCISDGLTNPMIAKKLSISEHTVNTHRKNIFKKLDVHNIASLVKATMKRKK